MTAVKLTHLGRQLLHDGSTKAMTGPSDRPARPRDLLLLTRSSANSFHSPVLALVRAAVLVTPLESALGLALAMQSLRGAKQGNDRKPDSSWRSLYLCRSLPGSGCRLPDHRMRRQTSRRPSPCTAAPRSQSKHTQRRGVSLSSGA